MNALSPFAAFQFTGVEHVWFWALLTLGIAAVLGLTYAGIYRRSGRSFAWLLMLLRGAGMVALLLALAKPTWTRETDVMDPARVAIVLDNSLSMTLPGTGSTSRYDQARRAADTIAAALRSDRHGPTPGIDRFDITGSSVADAWPDRPLARHTDLARALTKSAAQLRSRPLAGIVLISDGMDNSGRGDFRELNGLPVPVYAVGFPSDRDPDALDLAVQRPRAPTRAMVHNEVQLGVPVSKTGRPEVAVRVLIKLNEAVLARQDVRLPADKAEQTVTVKFTPTQAGSFEFTAAVESDTPEKLLSNNAVKFPLRIDAEPIRVLYLEGFLRYEFKYLKGLLEDDPDVKLECVIRLANPDRPGPKDGKEVLTPDRLKNVDVVILGNMEASYLRASEYEALKKWLDEKNKALLLLGGYEAYGPNGFRSTPLKDVLPVSFADRPPYQTEAPFQLELTEDGQRHPIFELSKDRTRDAKAWQAAPPLLGASVVGPAKPGATVLAVDPKLSFGGKPAVVVALQRYGGGHTMVLTADSTWQWSRRPRVLGRADTLYSRFWGQTVRFLAGRSLDDQRPVLAVSTDRPDYEVGRPVLLRVQRQATRTDIDVANARVLAEVQPPSGRPVAVVLQPTSTDPNVFAGAYTAPAAGRYEARALLQSSDGKALANQAADFQVRGAELELDDPGTSPETLQTIATATQGRYFDIDRIDDLAGQIARSDRRTVQVRRTEFWKSPILFVAFLMAVSAEWFIRRRKQMV